MNKFVWTLLVAAAGFCAQAEILVKTGESIAYYGDSNTYQARWPKFFEGALKTVGVTFGRGKSTNLGKYDQSAQKLLDRLESDVLAKKPDWLVYVGCYYDPGAKGATPETYRATLQTTFKKLNAAGVKTIVLSIPLNYTPTDSKWNARIDAFNAVLKDEAKKAGFPFADSNALMKKYRAEKGEKAPPVIVYGNLLSPEGTLLTARALLQAVGMPEKDAAAVYDGWVKNAKIYPASVSFSANEWKLVLKNAEKHGFKNPDDYVKARMREALQEVVK